MFFVLLLCSLIFYEIFYVCSAFEEIFYLDKLRVINAYGLLLLLLPSENTIASDSDEVKEERTQRKQAVTRMEQAEGKQFHKFDDEHVSCVIENITQFNNCDTVYCLNDLVISDLQGH